MNRKIMIRVGAIGIIICLLGVFGIKYYIENQLSAAERGFITIHTASFSLSIYDKYKLQTDESFENEKYFDSPDTETVLFVYDTLAGNADLEANVAFYKSMLAESYAVAESEIKALACPIASHDNCYYLTWEYTKDNRKGIAVSYIIYEEGTILVLTETGYHGNEQSMKEELLNMAQTVNYTGDYHLPKAEEYPFSVENSCTRITVEEGFYSHQTAGMENGQNQYITDADTIVVRYAATDDYDKGIISKFTVEKLTDQKESIKVQAENTYQKFLSSDIFEDALLEEMMLGKVWPDISDTGISGIHAYKVSVNSKEAGYSADKYYIEIKNNKFCISISYPLKDMDTMDELYGLFYNVDFMTAD